MTIRKEVGELATREILSEKDRFKLKEIKKRHEKSQKENANKDIFFLLSCIDKLESNLEPLIYMYDACSRNEDHLIKQNEAMLMDFRRVLRSPCWDYGCKVCIGSKNPIVCQKCESEADWKGIEE